MQHLLVILNAQITKICFHSSLNHTQLQVCIDVIVQRLGDATAAGMYKLLFSTLNGRTSTVSLYALPVCFNQFPGYPFC